MASLNERFSKATGDAPIVPILLLMGGFYLVWFGVKYWEDTTVIWPSDPVKSVLQGKGLPSHNVATTTAIELDSAESQQATAGASASPGGSPPTGPVAPGLSHYSPTQLEQLWIMAGGDPGKASVASCIAQHESSGDPSAESPNPDGGTNVGLWQLDTKGKGAGFSITQLKNPLTNARVAVKGSSNGTDWSAWSTAPMCGV